MQDRQVVEVEVTVVCDLPVRSFDDPTAEEMPFVEAELREAPIVAGQKTCRCRVLDRGLSVTQINPARSAAGSAVSPLHDLSISPNSRSRNMPIKAPSVEYVHA